MVYFYSIWLQSTAAKYHCKTVNVIPDTHIFFWTKRRTLQVSFPDFLGVAILLMIEHY